MGRQTIGLGKKRLTVRRNFYHVREGRIAAL
jgi:hypothetical protein